MIPIEKGKYGYDKSNPLNWSFEKMLHQKTGPLKGLPTRIPIVKSMFFVKQKILSDLAQLISTFIEPEKAQLSWS